MLGKRLPSRCSRRAARPIESIRGTDGRRSRLSGRALGGVEFHGWRRLQLGSWSRRSIKGPNRKRSENSCAACGTNFGRSLFEWVATNDASTRQVVIETREGVGLYRSKPFDDAAVLQSAASYLTSIADLCLHATRFSTPAAMVEHMATRILYFSRDPVGPRKKAWMYMRWMVRPAPDRRLFSNCEPRDLEMPLDSNTCLAFKIIREWLPDDPLLAQMSCDPRGIPQADAQNRQLATAFARSLFEDDPVIMDYPLFLLGRRNRRDAA